MDERIYTLPEVEWYSPAEALNMDRISGIPAERPVKGLSPQGSLLQQIQKDGSTAVRDYGAPGTLAQVQGSGKSAEDIGVQALGVSLNPPQGGGFDFSTLPQFLWDSYSFRPGAAQGAFDPRAVAGSMTLVPWTAQALEQPQAQTHFSLFQSTSHLSQISIGTGNGFDFAALAGFSAGIQSGPSGSFSWKPWKSQTKTVRIHLLATRIRSDTPGPTNAYSPQAKQITVRWMPVAQWDWKTSEQALLKTNLYYDDVFLRNTLPPESHSFIRQTGVEASWVDPKWKWGLNTHRTFYRTDSFFAPDETVFHLSGSRLLRWKGDTVNFLFEPTAGLSAVTAYGFHPEGGLGFRQEFGSLSSWEKVHYSQRYPSLNDRYYAYPQSVLSNPGLTPEQDWTSELGSASSWQTGETRLTLVHQHRRDVQLLSTLPSGLLQTRNAGIANVTSLTHEIQQTLTSWMQAQNALTWNRSFIASSGLAFPYLPDLIEAFSLRIQPAGEASRWRFNPCVRWIGNRQTTATKPDQLGGYALMDAELGLRILSKDQLNATLAVQNIFDRRYEAILNYPALGQTFTVQLAGTF